MARSELLLKLVRAGSQGDQEQIQRIVEAIAAEERAKDHNLLADKLLAQLQLDNGCRLRDEHQASNTSFSKFLAETIPKRRMEDLILPADVEQVIRELIAEQRRADNLRSFNLEPRHRVLLTGPPGNGKTSLAEALADALCVPLLAVQYDAVIESYLGETAQRIGKVFEEVRLRPCVLFFDEFDAVGKERGDRHETGEIKRVVSSLLLQIDALPSDVVVVAATNHPELLDRAVWRRFQVCVSLPPPTPQQIGEWFERFKQQHGLALGLSSRSLGQQLQGLSFSEVEDFGLDILRAVALNQADDDTKTVVESRLRHRKQRFDLEQSIGVASNL